MFQPEPFQLAYIKFGEVIKLVFVIGYMRIVMGVEGNFAVVPSPCINVYSLDIPR